MRVTLKIDSATDEEMRRAVLAWHFTENFYDRPALALDGLVVKVCGTHWTIESPPIPPKRADQIIEATTSDKHLGWLKLWRDETKLLDLEKELYDCAYPNCHQQAVRQVRDRMLCPLHADEYEQSLGRSTDQENPLWDDDLIQFARLLCEINATQDSLDLPAIAESMDLEVTDVAELFNRADDAWELAKGNRD